MKQGRRAGGFVTIDRIEPRPGGRRALILRDGREITVGADAIERSGVAAGMAAAEQVIAEMEAAVDPAKVHQAALKLLRYRARNEKQLRSKLLEKGFPIPQVDEELARLREVGLLDDRAFANAFVEERMRASPKSRRLVQMELTAKGVDRQLAAESVAVIDDAAMATELARKRLRAAALPYDDYVSKTGPFLLRRGFGFDIAKSAMRRAWEEERGATPER